MLITGTFLDEISHDIPHQNWGRKEWDKDFRSMREIGIDTVIMIRCGHRNMMTFPSEVLSRKENAFLPPLDLLELFLKLAGKYGMDFYFGGYDSGRYWANKQFESEVDINLAVFDEVWKKYGHYPAFRGWYLPHEVGRNTGSIIPTYARMGRHCKQLSGLPVLISPFISGAKGVNQFAGELRTATGISVAEHEKEWNAIFDGIREAVDIVAFQDGHVDFHELTEFLNVNKSLADKYGLRSWTNSESFDRDMPIKFLPIKWDKMLLKLNAAEAAGIDKAITFEFSHFMSPNSCYFQAHGLYNRYREHFYPELFAKREKQLLLNQSA
ncbi:MAG: DUF4434 domain-containing protein [Victivallaceae bacterium]|nr:DUF4434 domain-containing protein [Victivallaceae bacterium]